MLRRPAAALLMAGLSALPAAAQVTPSEVWRAWQSGPLELSAAELDEEDGALVLRGVTVTLTDGGRAMLDRVTLAPDGDAVRATAAPEARLIAPDAGDEGTLAAPEASLRVTGRPGALVHTLDAPRLTLDRPGEADLALALDALSGRVEGASGGFLADLRAGTGTLEIVAGDGESRTVSRQRWTTPAMTYDGPLAPSVSAPAEARFVTDGTRIVTESGGGTLAFDAARTETRATLTGARIDLSHLSSEGRAVIETESAPRIEADIAELSLDLDTPAVPGAGSAPAALDLAMDGVRLREETWARLDPDGALPRDPAALTLALRADLARGATPAPGFERVEIDEARIDALGAVASATGTLVFPEGAPDGAAPRPDGVIDLTLTGVSDLIDDLAAAGLLGEAQALFARLGLGQITRPGEAEGARVAEIVFGPDGSISIGGLTLR